MKNQFQVSTSSNTFSFEDSHSIDFLVAVANHIQSIIPKYKIPEFNFNEKYLEGYKLPADAMEKRVLFLGFSTDREIPNGLITKIQKIIENNPSYVKNHTLDLNYFIDFYPYMDIILDSISFLPLIRHLIIPKSSQKCQFWKLLANFIYTNSTITMIETHETLSPQFSDFSDALIKATQTIVTGISFHDNIFGEKFVIKLSNILEKGYIKSIAIENRLNLQGYQMLRPLVATNIGFQSLIFLSLTGCKYVQISDILEYLTDLQTLILNNSKLNLTLLFEQLNKYQSHNLRSLHISGNKFLTPIEFDIKLPSKLTSLHLDNVQWCDNAMEKIIRAISLLHSDDSHSFFALSISNSLQTNSQWNSFYNFIESFDCKPLKKLYFDKNPIQKQFCNFIKISSGIINLSLRGCLNYETPFLNELGVAFGENKSIQKLSISGMNEIYLSDSIEKLLKGFSGNKTISLLDLSKNHSGDIIIPCIIDLFKKCNSLTELFFDENDLNIKSLRLLFNKLQEENICGKIHLPRNDLTKYNVSQREKLNLQAILEVVEKRLTLKNSNNSKFEKEDSIEFKNSPESEQSYSNLSEESVYPYTLSLAPKIPEEFIKDIKEVNEKLVQDKEWAKSLEYVPDFDEDKVFNELSSRFAIQNLIDEYVGKEEDYYSNESDLDSGCNINPE